MSSRPRVPGPQEGPVLPARTNAQIWQSTKTHLDRIEHIEKQIRKLQAEQLRHGAGFVRDHVELSDGAGFAVGTATQQAMASEVALARGVSSRTADIWLTEAWMLDEH